MCAKKYCIRDDEVTEDEQYAFSRKYINATPNSGLPKSLKTTRVSENTTRPNEYDENTQEDIDDFFELMINRNYLKTFVPLMQSLINEENNEYLKNVRKTLEECISICKATICQTNVQWSLERKKRITGSISYNLFTYANNKQPDWQKKLASLYQSNFQGNGATRYELFAEKLA